jgi:hypothetical protein
MVWLPILAFLFGLTIATNANPHCKYVSPTRTLKEGRGREEGGGGPNNVYTCQCKNDKIKEKEL